MYANYQRATIIMLDVYYRQPNCFIIVQRLPRPSWVSTNRQFKGSRCVPFGSKTAPSSLQFVSYFVPVQYQLLIVSLIIRLYAV